MFKGMTPARQPPDRRRRRRGSGRPLPRAGQAAERPRRPALRRRAADADPRPGARPQAAPAARRRALARPRPAGRRPPPAGGARAPPTSSGTAVLMVEQHARKALNYTDHAIVMRRGRVALDLTGEQARTRIGEVEQAYLTSAGGDVAKGDAELAAEHNSRPGSAEPVPAAGEAALTPGRVPSRRRRGRGRAKRAVGRGRAYGGRRRAGAARPADAARAVRAPAPGCRRPRPHPARSRPRAERRARRGRARRRSRAPRRGRGTRCRRGTPGRPGCWAAAARGPPLPRRFGEIPLDVPLDPVSPPVALAVGDQAREQLVAVGPGDRGEQRVEGHEAGDGRARGAVDRNVQGGVASHLAGTAGSIGRPRSKCSAWKSRLGGPSGGGRTNSPMISSGGKPGSTGSLASTPAAASNASSRARTDREAGQGHFASRPRPGSRCAPPRPRML